MREEIMKKLAVTNELKNLRDLPRPKVPIGWDTYGLSTYHPEAFYYEGGQRF